MKEPMSAINVELTKRELTDLVAVLSGIEFHGSISSCSHIGLIAALVDKLQNKLQELIELECLNMAKQFEPVKTVQTIEGDKSYTSITAPVIHPGVSGFQG